MQISNEIKKSLNLANHTSVIQNDVFVKLVENCFSVLATNSELHNTASLYNSKPDVIKELYAALLTISAEFARNNCNQETVHKFLTNECNVSTDKVTKYVDLYNENKVKLQIQLGNIGTHLPHIVDVKWKIDYIVKSSNLDESEGPIFRVVLLTEAYDAETDGKKCEEVKFSCTSQELQALIYKLKEAERHCQRIGLER